MRTVAQDLEQAVAYHGHLCSGQVIGVRMARYGAKLLCLGDPRDCRDLIVYVESDRCITDAISTVTGCQLGRRRLKWMDYGKTAATFLNAATGEAVRVLRTKHVYPPDGADIAAFFDAIPDEELFTHRRVKVQFKPEDLPGKPLYATFCQQCGEEVIDGRQVERDGRTLCKACADGGYYVLLDE